MLGIVFAACGAGERNSLVTDDARAAIYCRRIDTTHPSVRLATRDKEGLCLMHHVKPGEVQITAIHDVDRANLQHQHIEHIHIAQLAVGNVI